MFSCNKKQQSCNRDCLIGIIDQYLEALESDDPLKLPLADNVRYTENGQTLELGDGIWGTSS
jgi:hypothetical protein